MQKNAYYVHSLPNNVQNRTAMLEILKYILPSLVVLLCAWIVMAKQMKNEDARRNFELRKQSQNVISPIRLRGYERLSLFLERITPEHMLIDLDYTGMTIPLLQQHLLRTIRAEFEHNMSQQIYVSDEVWTAIVLAKEEMMRFVNTCAMRCTDRDTVLTFAQAMITTYSSNGETPTMRAQQLLKDEVRTLL